MESFFGYPALPPITNQAASCMVSVPVLALKLGPPFGKLSSELLLAQTACLGAVLKMETRRVNSLRQRQCNDEIRVVNSGKVYDITDFAGEHPGGFQILKRHAGQDVTQAMREIHQHSKLAYTILEKYHVGELNRSPLKNGRVNGVKNGKVGGLPDGKENCFTDLCDPYENDLVDWDQPIMAQIPLLGENYFEWIHTPVDRHLRLFHSDFVEYFSKCSWWIVPIIWVPVLLALLWNAFVGLYAKPDIWLQTWSQGVEIRVGTMPFLFIMGIFLWTLAEYSIHRWIFHANPPRKFPLLVQLHFLLHGQHHKAPRDSRRLVFPPIPATVFVVLIYIIYAVFFPMLMSLTLLAGSLAGYLIYDMTHYYLHHGMPTLQYFKELKRYHVRHHFVEQDQGFGISSKFWDYPFGTLISK